MFAHPKDLSAVRLRNISTDMCKQLVKEDSLLKEKKRKRSKDDLIYFIRSCSRFWICSTSLSQEGIAQM